MSFVTGLRCRECARPFPAEALHVCDFCFGPLEVVYDYEALGRVVTKERIASGPSDDLALRGPSSGGRPFADRPRSGHDAAGEGGPPGSRARTRRALDQRRHRQPDRIVQGPCRLGGADQSARARIQGCRMRVHRQSRQLRCGARGSGRDAVGGLRAARPRKGQDRHDRRSTAGSWSRSKEPTTT